MNTQRSKSQPIICFIANYTKTYTFHETARRLEQYGARVFWIVVNEPIRRYLAGHYPSGRILYVNRRFADTPGKKIGEFKINELVLGDRVLSLDPDEGRKYLLNIQKPIYEFLEENQITHVFGELTWAHEILVRRIVSARQELHCKFFNPHTIRIPNGRFAFFTDEYQYDMFPANDSDRSKVASGYSVQKPDYLALNDRLLMEKRSLAARLAKVKRFITGENIDPDDPTLINRRWTRLKVRLREELNRELYRFTRRMSLDEINGRPFVFVALHKQPEASIDVIGRYYEDQYTNIVNVWRIIPDDWLVLIKEHTNAIGDRDLSFYRRLTRLPNIHLVREDIDSHDLIRGSELVLTVSGTVAYEAALMGKPALTLAPVFFNRFPNCRQIGLEDLARAEDIHQLIGSAEAGEVDEVDPRTWVLQHSFEGVISDPISNPKSTDPENLDKLADAILQVTQG